MPHDVLIIDDDIRLTRMLKDYLEQHGFLASCVEDAEAGIAMAQRKPWDIVVLDVMLPGIDGFEACRRLRSLSDVPIIMLTARGNPTDRIVGLEIGADDYLSKPFDPRELVARLQAILRRRVSPTMHGEVQRYGFLEFDLPARQVRCHGEVKSLTSRQFDILRVLIERPSRVQSREQIMQRLGSDESYEVFDRSIDVHISRIRAAIETDPKHPTMIRSVRGVGYVFTPPAKNDASRDDA